MTFEEFTKQFQIHLNEQQLAAVQSVEAPTLLLAVPGSGKTTVLVTRLGYMIYCCGIEPERILTVTYTVAATKDMQRRFAAVFGEELAARLEFRTINGICAKIINYYGRMVGKAPFELMTDEGARMKLLSEVYLKLTKEYPTESDLKNLSVWITYIKNMQLTPDEIDALAGADEVPLQEIYNEYCSRMRALGRMDFDDQMVYALAMLRKNPQLLEHFQEMYPYLCVDEAQDTSKIQHMILAELAGKYHHLFMVGDEDQSIYGFRAAYPEALLDFEKNHAGARVLVMEENFRSNARIVSAADHFIQKNEFRHKKTMRPFRTEGSAIRQIEVKSRKAQYTYLLKVAESCAQETAVLYRDNESILPVVDLLERKGIDYRIKNADLTFFSHRVVLDIETIIQFAADPCNTELFLKIYYKIGTYLSKAAAIEACRASEKKGIPVLEAALRFGNIPAGSQKSVKAIQKHMEALLEDSAVSAVYRIVKDMGYEDFLERAHIKDSKIPIIEAIAAGEPSALRLVERLQELSEIIREKKSAGDCKLIFSTIHSSKGLEYDTVYLIDAKDGIFPETVIKNRKGASQEELKQYEEERRLYYVGVTRAKNNLAIFRFPGSSTFTGELLDVERFAVETSVKTSKTAAKTAINRTRPYESVQRQMPKAAVSEQVYKDKLEELKTTGYVKHKTLGEGVVLSISGDVIEIDFGKKKSKCSLRFMMERGFIE